MPVKSSFASYEEIRDARKAFFKVPSKKKGQKPIYFGKVKPELLKRGSSEEDDGVPQFHYHEPNSIYLMKRMGYNFNEKNGLNFGKGRRTPVRISLTPEGKPPDYYQKNRRCVGYVTSLFLSEDETGDCLCQDHSSGTPSWESDISFGAFFKSLTVNMVLTRCPDEDTGGDEELIESINDHWIKRLNILWGMRFEQRKPPTEDNVIQVNMGDESDPKPIFISESLSPSEKEDLISLIREYIDIFAWSYEDMSGLNPKVAMNRLNIDPDAKPVK